MVSCTAAIYEKNLKSVKKFLHVETTRIWTWIWYVYYGGKSEKKCILNYLPVCGTGHWRDEGNIQILVKTVIAY